MEMGFAKLGHANAMQVSLVTIVLLLCAPTIAQRPGSAFQMEHVVAFLSEPVPIVQLHNALSIVTVTESVRT
jgi:hypothetical protein